MKAVDYGSVSNFIPIVKEFYQECEAVQSRSEQEVMAWRGEKEVLVQGPANFKPILQFMEAGIPEYLMSTISAAGYQTPTTIQSQSWPIGKFFSNLLMKNPLFSALWSRHARNRSYRFG